MTSWKKKEGVTTEVIVGILQYLISILIIIAENKCSSTYWWPDLQNKQPQFLNVKAKQQKELEQKFIFMTQKKIERIEEGRTFF
jgi:7,8-dihydro-6-hydroxymethylpterin-pyrophosphokinase